MKLVVSLFLTTILLLSCKQEKKADDTSTDTKTVEKTIETAVVKSPKMEAVIALHDEVMPKMSELGVLSSNLTNILKESDNKREIEKTIQDLKDSQDSMMSWMMRFSNRFEPEEILRQKEIPSNKIKWLIEEEKSIKKLREKTNLSISTAKKLLEK